MMCHAELARSPPKKEEEDGKKQKAKRISTEWRQHPKIKIERCVSGNKKNPKITECGAPEGTKIISPSLRMPSYLQHRTSHEPIFAQHIQQPYRLLRLHATITSCQQHCFVSLRASNIASCRQSFMPATLLPVARASRFVLPPPLRAHQHRFVPTLLHASTTSCSTASRQHCFVPTLLHAATALR